MKPIYEVLHQKYGKLTSVHLEKASFGDDSAYQATVTLPDKSTIQVVVVAIKAPRGTVYQIYELVMQCMKP